MLLEPLPPCQSKRPDSFSSGRNKGNRVVLSDEIMKLVTLYVTWVSLWLESLVLGDIQTMTRKKNSIQISNSSDHDKHTAALPTLFMTGHCRTLVDGYLHDKDRIYVDSSIVVEATPNLELETQTTCVVTFAARDPSERLILHFESMDINFRPGTIDRLRIYDGYDCRDNNEKTPGHGLYGIYLKNKYERSSGSIHDYTSTGPALTLFFIGELSREFTGFRALITVFREPKLDGTCVPSYLKCATSRCIPDALRCNGYQNCGQNDHTDSQDCNNTPPPMDRNMGLGYSADLGLMVGCAISIVILMVVVLWLGIVCIKRTKRYRASRRYHSPSPHIPAPHSDVDGAIVEPADIHHVVAPPIAFLEPPPPYSAQPVMVSPRSRQLELPPPYAVDERDTAGLLINESPDGNCPPDTPRVVVIPPSNSASQRGDSLPMVMSVPSRIRRSPSPIGDGLTPTAPPRSTVSSRDISERKHDVESGREAVDVDPDAPMVPPRVDSHNLTLSAETMRENMMRLTGLTQ